MSCCTHCRDAGGFFSRRTAARERRRYRRKGPPKSTRLLIEALRNAGVRNRTLLDVGGGIGAIQHELFESGLAAATQVDASGPYLEAAREEAEERGNGDHVSFHFGDFVELAAGLNEADIVTLDRVLCCYPHLDALLEASTGRAGRILGLVYPRERLGTRIFMALGNLWFRVRGSAFRVFLHPPERVHERVRSAGFQLAGSDRTFLWRVESWVRGSGA